MTFNRNEQLALIALSCALFAGGMVNIVSFYLPRKTPDFQILKAAVEVPAMPAEIRDTPEAPTQIDLNHATQKELQVLPRIGPKAAQRIVDFRTRNGPFKSIEDLISVQGIGPKTLDQLRPLIAIK